MILFLYILWYGFIFFANISVLLAECLKQKAMTLIHTLYVLLKNKATMCLPKPQCGLIIEINDSSKTKQFKNFWNMNLYVCGFLKVVILAPITVIK